MNLGIEFIVSILVTAVGVAISVGYFKHKVDDTAEDLKEWKNDHKEGCKGLKDLVERVNNISNRTNEYEVQISGLFASIAEIKAKLDSLQEIKDSIKRIDNRLDLLFDNSKQRQL
jgi:DNA repair ATPase RecN